MYRYIELWGFYDTICNAFYRVMARNNEKNPEKSLYVVPQAFI